MGVGGRVPIEAGAAAVVYVVTKYLSVEIRAAGQLDGRGWRIDNGISCSSTLNLHSARAAIVDRKIACYAGVVSKALAADVYRNAVAVIVDVDHRRPSNHDLAA